MPSVNDAVVCDLIIRNYVSQFFRARTFAIDLHHRKTVIATYSLVEELVSQIG